MQWFVVAAFPHKRPITRTKMIAVCHIREAVKGMRLKIPLLLCSGCSRAGVACMQRAEGNLEDLYVVTLLPEEFHELLSEYENYVEWVPKSMREEEKELFARVLAKLQEADATHVCIDAPDKEEGKR
jgi:hypothetical protein